MIKIIFTVLIVVAVAVYADAKKKCFPVPTPVVGPPLPPQPACAKNEVYSECGANGCQNTCENPTFSQVCRAMCVAGCVCKEGYLRDSKGKCVLVKDCPQKCKKFEIFSDCAPEACKRTCDTLNTACKAPCVPGCKCPENHVYKDDNRDACILEEECPQKKCIKAHESYTVGTECPPTCENQTPICNKKGIFGCFCDHGYIRNNNGDCILIKDCPASVPECKKANEIYKCETECELTCEERIPRPCTRDCVKGCFCDEGYFRDKKGNCVLVKDCYEKPKCREFEISSDCVICPKSCDTLNIRCKGPCVPGCKCPNNYVYSDKTKTKCVPIKECPQACRKAHESYTDCGTPCPPTCENPIPEICKKRCVAGCFCDEGYMRDNKGNCILVADCPKPVCKDYEIFSDCAPITCSKTCNTLSNVCKAACVPGCKCPKNLVYSDDKKVACIPEEKCPQFACKKPHESYTIGTECPPTCENQTPFCNYNTVFGCFCYDGYIRNKNGDCILIKDCPVAVPVCKKAHESYTDCGTACPQTCENLNSPPKACIALCVPGCFCDAGYIRNSKGDCVLKEECPVVVPVCPKNEVYSKCGANNCQSTCENPTRSNLCKGICMAGCICKEGYLRDSNGKCVPEENCPIKCKKANESYNKCGTACPLTCEEPLPRPCTKQCVKGCFCDKGYLRDKKGNCVKVEDCPKPKCGNNENYNECGASPCQATCKEPNLPKMCKAPCKPGCGCNDGYVRDDDGDCILLKKCPPALECGDNEVYEACTHLCGEPTCKRSEPLYCGLGECQPKCLCKKGYVRTPEGDCIPKEKCPAFECKKEHEIYTTCGTACPLTCKNRIPDICTKQCVAGCFCDKGYVRGSQGDCVLPDKCPIMIVDVRPPTKCEKEHENYTTCGSACPLTCENPTPGPCTKNCVRGCFCVEGYVRDYKGNCIRAKDCPKSKCGKNKNYNKCGDNPCEATCNSPSLPFRCHGPCKPGCGCNDGYFRDKEGNCVLLKNCPPKLTCEDNEDYEICTTLCEEPSCDKKEASYCGYECKPRCVCKKGYVRNAEKKCIKSKDCQASQPGSGNGSSGSS